MGLAFWVLMIFLVFRFFSTAQLMILGIVAASVLASVLKPLADKLPGPMGVRAGLAGLALLLALVVLLGGMGWAMYGTIASNFKSLTELREKADAGLRSLGQRLGLSYNLTLEQVAERAGEMLTGESLAEFLPNLANGILGVGLALGVVLIGGLYLLTHQSGSLAGQAVKLLPPRRRQPTLDALNQLWPQYRAWALGSLFSMTVVGVISGIGYWIVGLSYALPLGVLGLVEMIPTFGPALGLIMALLVAATQGAGQVVGVVIVYLIIQNVESYLLTPLVMKKAVHIPPVVSLFTIVLWGNIFGMAGLILAIPLNLTVWTMLKKHIIEWEEDTG
jgi:predicted PurR-regulated permease PerM